jgi:hypothetical protein
MHLVGCASIMNPFQMKSMKVMCNIGNTMNKKVEHSEES